MIDTNTSGVEYYNIICNTRRCGSSHWYSPYSFKVSIINCKTPPIILANIQSSYSFNIQSQFYEVNVLSGYV